LLSYNESLLQRLLAHRLKPETASTASMVSSVVKITMSNLCSEDIQVTHHGASQLSVFCIRHAKIYWQLLYIITIK